MKKTILIYHLSIILLTACSIKNIETERVNVKAVIVYDNIESRMPGQLILSYPYIVWTDPLSFENQVHVIDLNTRKEINRFINIGNGPEEFVTPFFSISTNHKLIAYDMNRNKMSIFSLDSINERKPATLTFDKVPQNITQIAEIGNNSFTYFLPNAQFPFQTDNGIRFGKYPFEGKIENKYNISQGNIAYNSQNCYFIYATISFPYTAAYQKKGNTFELMWEKKGNIDYTLAENKIILNGKKTGAMELALTKDYIVTLQRDYQNDPTDEREVGRDFTKLPKTLFLYDYKSNLRKIINLNMPLLRIAADTKNNTVYAIAVNPDFMLIKCEISD